MAAKNTQLLATPAKGPRISMRRTLRNIDPQDVEKVRFSACPPRARTDYLNTESLLGHSTVINM